MKRNGENTEENKMQGKPKNMTLQKRSEKVLIALKAYLAICCSYIQKQEILAQLLILTDVCNNSKGYHQNIHKHNRTVSKLKRSRIACTLIIITQCYQNAQD